MRERPRISERVSGVELKRLPARKVKRWLASISQNQSDAISAKSWNRRSCDASLT